MRTLVDSFSLREINFAKTRLKILQVVKERVLEKDFEEVTVDEICRYAEISRGTFFNYFPTKNDIFKYYIRIWKIKMGLEMAKLNFKEKTAEGKLIVLYSKLIGENKEFPGFFRNYLKHIIDAKEIDDEIKLTQAEFAYEFPEEELDIDEIEALNSLSLDKILKNILNEGIIKGEFKKDLDVENSSMFLISIFFSPIIIYRFMSESYDLREYYEYTLDHLFQTIKA
ncbi:MAG: TetR family transcriptional regulator [Epulopiscium sp.]|nr:TetR family transcriptional regulator [Candidatus Epulonipiscium sp.]